MAPLTLNTPLFQQNSATKILKRCIHSQLMDYLETHKLSEHQFGFCRKCSTEVYVASTIFEVADSERTLISGAIYRL